MTTSHKKRIALLFSGQGAQTVGMGQDLAAQYPSVQKLFAEADAKLGFSLSKIAFEGPAEELTRTSVCQPALYVHGIACLTALKERVPNLDFVATAGLSLGEFTAHCAAQYISFCHIKPRKMMCHLNNIFLVYHHAISFLQQLFHFRVEVFKITGMMIPVNILFHHSAL